MTLRYSDGIPHPGCLVQCQKCFAEAIETVDRKEWFRFNDFARGLELGLPVLHRYHRCTVCGHEEQDADTGREHATIIAAYRRPNHHHWTPFPTSFCEACGVANPVELAIEKGYFDADSHSWESTQEADNAQWNTARINIFGCHVRHSIAVH